MVWIKVGIGVSLVFCLGYLAPLAANHGLALASTQGGDAPTLLVLGDSLSAGYGLDPGTGWVALLDNKLKTQAAPRLKSWHVINDSVSGETTAGGLSRLPAALAQYHPQVLLIELGGNDGLRGEPIEAMRANLAQLITLGKGVKAQILLFEMRIPSNYGPVYTDKFTRAFAEVAHQESVELIPFFLQPLVADRARWFQDDALHPNAAAQPLMLDAVWGRLLPALKGTSIAGSASSKRGSP